MKNSRVYVLLAILSFLTYIFLYHCGAINIGHSLMNQVQCGIERLIEGK